MSQEQSFDVISWWSEVNFDGKQLFTLSEEGKLVIYAGDADKERTIAEITEENSAEVISALGEKFYHIQGKVEEIATEWVACDDKLKMADKVASVVTMIQTTPALGNVEKLAAAVAVWKEVIDAIYDENYASRLKLTEQAEGIADSEEWKEATIAFKEIIEQWKQAGHTDKHRSDKLWGRIDLAKNKFYDRKKIRHEEQEKDLLHNLDLKLDLVEQAEAMTGSTEWKKTADTFHRLTNEWKTIGHTLNKKNEELWQRFIAAKSAFFDRKREHTAHIQEEQEKNSVIKSALVEQAEALKESTEWSKTAQAYAALMEEWKKTGRVNGEKGDELWARFLGAQDHFFNAKRIHTEQIRDIHEQNYNLKMELIQRANQIKNSSRWGDATAEMNELLDEWKKTGPVSREDSNRIWDEFLAARKHFFARKDEGREQRKQFAEEQKHVRTEQAKEMVVKLQSELLDEEQKLIDFKEALNNVTPGKKAEELRKHLQNLLVEGEQKIKRLKEKYEAVRNEYGRKEPAKENNIEAKELSTVDDATTTDQQLDNSTAAAE